MYQKRGGLSRKKDSRTGAKSTAPDGFHGCGEVKRSQIASSPGRGLIPWDVDASRWLFNLGSIRKPSTRPNSVPFLPAVRHFSLQYTKYSREKMASSGGKSFAVGHISGFQIDPKYTQWKVVCQVKM